METIIKNGTIITATDTYRADVAIRDGRVVAISDSLSDSGADVIDARGCFVLPGAVDAHVHLGLPVGDLVSADDCEAGTRAAACGGVTTVFDFAEQQKGEGLVEDARRKAAQYAHEACVDFALHTAVTDMDCVDETQIRLSKEFGVTSLKAYMVYDIMLDDGALAELLALSKATGMLVEVHAENPAIIRRRIGRLKAEGKTAPWYHYESRPEFVEAEGVKRAIHLAKSMNARLYIVHLACAEGLQAVRDARAAGCEIYAETCPQYLHFTNEVYQRPDAQNFVCSPAIKGADSREALWQGIRHVDIDTVATDHCPFQSHEKARGKNDFTRIPNGCMGVETMYPYMLGEAGKGSLTYNQAVALCCANPARIFGCAPRKGGVAVGGDADIVIYDPEAEYTVTQRDMHSAADHTIWEGLKIRGRINMTLSRGRVVYRDDGFTGEPGWGRFVPCE